MNAPMSLGIADEDLARADAYAVLAHLLFAPPDAALVLSLHCSLREGEGALTATWNAMCEAAVDSTEIADEYEDLFISIGKPRVPLHASWYLTGFLMEKPLALLRDDLAQLGLVRNEDKSESEDHIAGELDVMRHLILTGGKVEIDEAVFFRRHIKPWYGDLCNALMEVSGTPFYQAVANFMRAFLDMERDYFALQSDRNGGVK